MPETMPTLFISHGAPDMGLTRPPVAAFLAGLPASLPRPRAILCISAHWETRQPALTAATRPATIYDFYGFSPELYRITYGAPGDERLARKVLEMLEAAGVDAGLDPGRGLDHGAWVPLRLMYPKADVPVVQLSIQPHRGAEHHLALGHMLEPLRAEGVLILGSGGATHNLREFHNYAMDAPPVDRAAAFERWVNQCIATGDTASLCRFGDAGPHARWNHPSVEHFLPLFVPLGASGGDPGSRLHHSFTYGVLSMAAYGWGFSPAAA